MSEEFCRCSRTLKIIDCAEIFSNETYTVHLEASELLTKVNIKRYLVH